MRKGSGAGGGRGPPPGAAAAARRAAAEGPGTRAPPGPLTHLPHPPYLRNPQVFNGNGVLAQVESPDTIQNVPACFATKLYADLGCTCWGKAMADCTDTHWFCRSCVKDWKRVRGSPGAEYTPVSGQGACG